MRLTIIILLMIMFISGCSIISYKKTSLEEIERTVNIVNNSKIIVLDVYHNRCESCKLIEPVIEKLKTNYSNNSDIAFLKYDLSNPFTIFYSRKIAKGLGLENIYKSQRFSGVVLFIDSKSKEVLNTLVSEYNPDKYTEVIERRLSGT